MKQKAQNICTISRSRCCSWFAAGILVLLGNVFGAVDGFACSAIAIENPKGDLVVGGNFDWRSRGGLVFLSPRGQVKVVPRSNNVSNTALSETIKSSRAGPIQWQSRYASLTLSQFGRDYPMQGLNERGLVGMVLMGPAEYAEDGRYGWVTENLWLQFQLDTYATVKEVADHIHDIGIKKISARLHWFLCDATGECAIVEFHNSVARVDRSRDLYSRVLTNSGIAESWDYFSNWLHSGLPPPTGYDSLARFSRLAWRLTSGESFAVQDALNDVALEGFTAWQALFDLKRQGLWAKLEGGDWQYVSFAALDLTCRRDLPVYNPNGIGWERYDHDATLRLLNHAVQGLSTSEIKNIERAFYSSESVSCGTR